MDKQELIEIMESLVTRHSNDGECPNVAVYNAYVNSLGWIEKLAEQQKPVIPKFVAEFVDWVTKRNWAPSDAIREFQNNTPDTVNLPETLELEKLDEYFEIAYNRYDFERACILGYKVEEPLYTVPLPDLNTASLVCYALLRATSGEILIGLVTKNELGVQDNTKLTEQEIKAFDERYWAFAEKVKENKGE